MSILLRKLGSFLAAQALPPIVTPPLPHPPFHAKMYERQSPLQLLLFAQYEWVVLFARSNSEPFQRPDSKFKVSVFVKVAVLFLQYWANLNKFSFLVYFMIVFDNW